MFVLGDNVTLYVHQVKVAIAPQTFEVNVKPFLLGLDVTDSFVSVHLFYVLYVSESQGTKQLLPARAGSLRCVLLLRKFVLLGLWLFVSEMWHGTVKCECYSHSILPSLVETLVLLFCSDRASEPESDVHSRCLFPTDFTDLHG